VITLHYERVYRSTIRVTSRVREALFYGGPVGTALVIGAFTVVVTLIVLAAVWLAENPHLDPDPLSDPNPNVHR
jgi:hypothetical protein